MNPSEKHILEIDSVELSFGDRRILSGVYLAVETGGVTAVLGRNGCGKSCLMKILCGSLRADFRSMRIDGVWHDRFRADEVRYLAQQGFIPGWLTVDRALRDFGLPWDDLLAWFPLFGKLRGTKIRALSGGERRILESYLILRSPTQFVMLDEPFSQVAPLHVSTLKALIRQEKSSKGILVTDHMHRHVTDITDRLYVLADGQTHLTRGEEDLVRCGYLAARFLLRNTGSGVSVSIETSRRLFDHTTMLVMCSLATTYCLLTRQNARGSMSSQMLSSVLL